LYTGIVSKRWNQPGYLFFNGFL